MNLRYLLLIIAAVTVSCGRAAALNFICSSTNFVGMNPFSLVLADVNGDGKPDIITGQYGSPTMTIYTNNGNGTFSFCSTNGLNGGAYHFSLVAGDFNGDGKMDVVCLHEAPTYHLTLLTNDGTGVFTAASLPGPVAFPPTAITGGDINGDGSMDLIVAHNGFAALTILTNNGFGIFSPSSTNSVGAGPECVVATDVNGDTKLDVVSFNEGVYSSYQGSITVLTNNGSGTLVSNATYTTATPISCGVAADVNGDGKPDLIWANGSPGNFIYQGFITVFTNNGHGIFLSNAVYNVGNSPAGLVAADFNGDGKVDLACVNQGDNDVMVLTNDGTGHFVPASTNIIGYGPVALAAGDVDGNGKLDLVCANSLTNTMTVLLNSPALPSLKLQPAAANAINLSWSAAWPGFELKQIQDLGQVNWASVTNSITTTQGTNYAVISTAAGNAFYRLAHP